MNSSEFILNILKKHNVDELHLWIEHFNANRDPSNTHFFYNKTNVKFMCCLGATHFSPPVTLPNNLFFWISESFLLDAASTARSMFLCHRKMNFIRRTQPCFPTMDDEDWISAILKMFSRRLDKLSIHKSIKGLLSHESLDIIREASVISHLQLLCTWLLWCIIRKSQTDACFIILEKIMQMPFSYFRNS